MIVKVLVTGGAGFIGSSLVRYLLRETACSVVNVDCLTYAAAPGALAEVEMSERYRFYHTNICDRAAIDRIFTTERPDLAVHLAAESHVDRSIDDPSAFVQTNILGTYTLLEAALQYWEQLDGARAQAFRFHHVSTDEVYGSLGAAGSFTEATAYRPRSPYSASKAASDHLVHAWHHTYGLPTVVSNCSNNYGPFQFPEKLIPLIIINAVHGKPLPVYGRGENVRDWLYVDDHAHALWTIATQGRIGETYNVGGASERRNIDVVEAICDAVDLALPTVSGGRRRDLITFVADRPGHDLRYAIDFSKLNSELGWTPRENFASGLAKTVDWYLANRDWWEAILAKRYDGGRLGHERAAPSRQVS